jgi:hypothetical protein
MEVYPTRPMKTRSAWNERARSCEREAELQDLITIRHGEVLTVFSPHRPNHFGLFTNSARNLQTRCLSLLLIPKHGGAWKVGQDLSV